MLCDRSVSRPETERLGAADDETLAKTEGLDCLGVRDPDWKGAPASHSPVSWGSTDRPQPVRLAAAVRVAADGPVGGSVAHARSDRLAPPVNEELLKLVRQLPAAAAPVGVPHALEPLLVRPAAPELALARRRMGARAVGVEHPLPDASRGDAGAAAAAGRAGCAALWMVAMVETSCGGCGLGLGAGRSMEVRGRGR